MATLTPIVFSSDLGKATKVFSGGGFSCFLSESGKVACFGKNTFGFDEGGLLGTGSDVPFGCAGCAPVNTLQGITFNAVTLVVQSMALGSAHACALFTVGRVMW